MGKERARDLLRVRAQMQVIHDLSEGMRRLAPGAVGSARMDGMPRARGGVPGGLDVLAAKRDAMQRILLRESALLRRYERAARKHMDGMKPELYAFCSMYYLGGFSIAEVSDAMDRSERQCLRYRKEIEQAHERAATAEDVGNCHLARENQAVL